MRKKVITALKEKYDKIQAPAKASIWFLICGFLQKAIAMLTMPIFTRILSTEDYGTFTIYQSWYNILSIIAGLNLAAGVYTRGLIKNSLDKDRFTSSLLGLSTLSTGIIFIIYIIGHRLWNNILKLSTFLMVLMFVEIIFHTAFQFWSNRQRVEYKYKKLVILTLANIVASQLAGIIMVLNSDSHKVEIKITITVVICVIMFFGLYINIFKRGKAFYNKDYWKYALMFNLPLIPHYLSQIVLNQSDRIMIANICGKGDAAIYGVAYSLAMVMMILNQSISSTMNPWIYQTIKDNKCERIGKISYSILIVIAFVNFILVACAPELLTIIAPDTYKPALWIIPPVAVSVYFTFLYNLFATFEYYFEKTKYVMFATVSGAVINIILNAIFIPMFGFAAAGYTTLVCYILYSFAHYIFMNKTVKANLPRIQIYNIGIIICIGVALLVCSGIIIIFYNNPIIRYALVVMGFTAVFLKRKQVLNIFRQLKER